MKASQRMLVIVSAMPIIAKQWDQPVIISFYSTAKSCREGVGDRADLNKAVYEAYWALEDSRKNQKTSTGISGSWNGYGLQLSMIKQGETNA